MAELNVMVRYRSATARLLFILMCILLPLWAIASPLSLVRFILMVLYDPSLYPLSSVFNTIFSLLAFSCASAAAFAVSADNRIYINRDGMTFPLFLSSRLGFRRHRKWDELASAGLTNIGIDGADKKTRILLGFASHHAVALSLAEFSLEQQEQLLMAMELWAPQCDRTLALSNYRKDLHDRGRLIGNAGYTQLWEEELSCRFSATSFVPLEPSAKLQSGNIEIVRQLAFGGLSALYLSQKNGRDLVVLKEAVIPLDADPELRAEAEAQLSREAELLAGLSHPRITKVLDYLVEEGRHYLVLEYIPGQDLRQYVKHNGALKEPQALQWAAEIADLLVYLHERPTPIIHRDITPENLLISKHSEIVLIDFGAANQFVGTATGTVVGKQAYIPPEQLRGKAVLPSDIYAFGGTIYFLLTGEDPRALCAGHPRQIVDELSEEIDAFVARCMSYDFRDRFADAQELRRALADMGASSRVKAGQG
jgi:hypothetical protein